MASIVSPVCSAEMADWPLPPTARHDCLTKPMLTHVISHFYRTAILELGLHATIQLVQPLRASQMGQIRPQAFRCL